MYTWTVRETTWTWRTECDVFTSPSWIVIIEMFIHNEYYTWLYLQSFILCHHNSWILCLYQNKICYPLANEVERGYSNATVRHNPCEHSRINILQWILTKLGTYLVLKSIWNPLDFQGQRSRSRSNFYRITSLWTL